MHSLFSQACKSVVQFMRKSIKLIQECLHGRNTKNVLIELGIRFHRVIYDHLLQYTYNSGGNYLESNFGFFDNEEINS